MDLAFRLTMGHFFNTTRQNMMSFFVLNFPECRITLCQSKIFRFMHVILFFLCSGNYMGVWKGNMISRIPFLLWRVYGYLWCSYFLFFIPVLTLVSDQNTELVGLGDRNHNHKSAIRNVALKIFKRSFKNGMEFSIKASSKDIYICSTSIFLSPTPSQ